MNKFDIFAEPTNNIPENADLNDYTEIGIYRCTTNTVAATFKNNIPINCAYKMIVMHANFAGAVRQIAITNQTDCKTYMRYYNSNGWHKWQLISTTEV